MGIQVFKGVAKQRAHLAGRVKKLQRDLAKLADRRTAIEAELSALAKQIESFDAVLAAQGIGAQGEDLFPAQEPRPRAAVFKHGELAALVLTSLRELARPVSAPQLVRLACERAGVLLLSKMTRKRYADQVRLLLRNYESKGLVVKAREAVDGDARSYAYWSLPEYADRDPLPGTGQEQYELSRR